jgi:hypothetical protein
MVGWGLPDSGFGAELSQGWGSEERDQEDCEESSADSHLGSPSRKRGLPDSLDRPVNKSNRELLSGNRICRSKIA